MRSDLHLHDRKASLAVHIIRRYQCHIHCAFTAHIFKLQDRQRNWHVVIWILEEIWLLKFGIYNNLIH